MSVIAPVSQRKYRKMKTHPELFFVSEGQRAAREAVKSVMSAEADIAVVTGCMGSGKTMMIAQLAEQLGQEVLYTRIESADLVDADSNEIVAFVLRAFGGEHSRDDLGKFVEAQEAEGRRVLLVVDDAHELSQIGLESIVNLADPLYQDEHPLRLILVGRPDLNQKLSTGSGIPLLPPGALQATVSPFTVSETIQFVTSRWEASKKFASCPFTQSAMAQIHYYSRGNPKSMIALGKLANDVAHQQGCPNVTELFIRQAVETPAWVLYAEALAVLHTPVKRERDTSQTLPPPSAFVFHQGEKVQAVTLDSQYTYIGKDARNAILAEGDDVSDLHACIEARGQKYYLHKLSGLHPLYVNASTVSQHTLNDGDIIRVGAYRILFMCEGMQLSLAETAAQEHSETPASSANEGVEAINFSRKDQVSDATLFKNMIDLPASDGEGVELLATGSELSGELQLVTDNTIETEMVSGGIDRLDADADELVRTIEMSLPPVSQTDQMDREQDEEIKTAEMLLFNHSKEPGQHDFVVNASNRVRVYKRDTGNRKIVWAAAAAVGTVLLAGTVVLMNSGDQASMPDTGHQDVVMVDEPVFKDELAGTDSSEGSILAEASSETENTPSPRALVEETEVSPEKLQKMSIVEVLEDDSATEQQASIESGLSDVALVPANLPEPKRSLSPMASTRSSAAFVDPKDTFIGGIDIFQTSATEVTEPELTRIANLAPTGDPIETLLRKGERELRNFQLMYPASGNAYATFLSVLERDPGNDRAEKGLNQIAEKYLQLAQAKKGRGDAEGSLSLIERGLRVNPDHLGLLALQQDIRQSIIYTTDMETQPEPQAHFFSEEPSESEVFVTEISPAYESVYEPQYEEVIVSEPEYEVISAEQPEEVWVSPEETVVESEVVVSPQPTAISVPQAVPVAKVTAPVVTAPVVEQTATRPGVESTQDKAEKSYKVAKRLMAEGDPRAALAMIHRGLKLDPGHAGLLSLRKKASNRLFAQIRAENSAKTSSGMDRQVKKFIASARRYQERGKLTKSLAAVEQGLLLEPGNLELLNYRSKLEKAIGR